MTLSNISETCIYETLLLSLCRSEWRVWPAQSVHTLGLHQPSYDGEKDQMTTKMRWKQVRCWMIGKKSKYFSKNNYVRLRFCIFYDKLSQSNWRKKKKLEAKLNWSTAVTTWVWNSLICSHFALSRQGLGLSLHAAQPQLVLDQTLTVSQHCEYPPISESCLAQWHAAAFCIVDCNYIKPKQIVPVHFLWV